MEFNINTKRLSHINKLICNKQTGSPLEFAKKVGISEATLYRCLRLMKTLGAPIEYDPIRQTYFYKRSGIFIIQFCDTEPVKVETSQEEISKKLFKHSSGHSM